jgi:hypothetical protein
MRLLIYEGEPGWLAQQMGRSLSEGYKECGPSGGITTLNLGILPSEFATGYLESNSETEDFEPGIVLSSEEVEEREKLRKKKKKALVDFEDAVKELVWLGSKPPEDHDEIRREYSHAYNTLYNLLMKGA